MHTQLTTVLEEIQPVLEKVEPDAVDAFAGRLGVATRVFVTGEGRSGFMAKAFAMRLMHLGYTVHVVGETTTPAVAAGDTLVAVSGSGTTAASVRVAERANQTGAEVLALTTDLNSPLGRSADRALLLPAATKHRRPSEAPSTQPLSTLFDQTTHILLDVICQLLSWPGEHSAAAARHANTE